MFKFTIEFVAPLIGAEAARASGAKKQQTPLQSQ